MKDVILRIDVLYARLELARNANKTKYQNMEELYV